MIFINVEKNFVLEKIVKEKRERNFFSFFVQSFVKVAFGTEGIWHMWLSFTFPARGEEWGGSTGEQSGRGITVLRPLPVVGFFVKDLTKKIILSVFLYMPTPLKTLFVRPWGDGEEGDKDVEYMHTYKLYIHICIYHTWKKFQ